MRLVFKLVRMAVLYVSHHYITGIRWYDDWRSVVLVSHLHNKQALIGIVECRHSPFATRHSPAGSAKLAGLLDEQTFEAYAYWYLAH